MLVPLASLVIGTIAFGWHPLTAIDGSSSTALHSTVVTLGPAPPWPGWPWAPPMWAGHDEHLRVRLPALNGHLSALAAVAGGVGLTIVSRVLNSDYLPGVSALNSYMPNNDVDLWEHLFQQPAQTAGMARFLVLQIVYVAVFLAGAWWWFIRKDILT